MNWNLAPSSSRQASRQAKRIIAGALTLLTVLSSPAFSAENDAKDTLTAAGCAAFGFDFYHQLIAEPGYQADSNTNLAISPISLASVLEVLRLGTFKEAHQQLSTALHSSEPGVAIGKPDQFNSPGVTLSLANSLWLDNRFKPKKPFLQTTEARFGSVIFNVNFGDSEGAAHRINGWINDNTAGHIKDLVTPDAVADAAMAIANAVYFKGNWAEPFQASLTADEPFHPISGTDTPAKMMHRTGEVGFAETDGIKMLELPYSGNSVSMILLLPSEPGGAAMAHLENTISAQWLKTATEKLAPAQVAVSIPRFTFQFQPKGCIPLLKALGITKIFDFSRDFAPIADDDLKVSVFIHRTWLKVDEKGTEAAAATVATIMPKMALLKPLEFTANRPFLFVIRHNATGTPLFVGRVSKTEALND